MIKKENSNVMTIICSFDEPIDEEGIRDILQEIRCHGTVEKATVTQREARDVTDVGFRE